MVTPQETSAEEVVLRLVRGELPLRASGWAGISVSRDPKGAWTIVVARAMVVMPSTRDVAAGLAGLLSKPEALREWANFILGASNVLSLERLEHEDGGDALLGALWDAAFTGVLKPEQVTLVRQLSVSP